MERSLEEKESCREEKCFTMDRVTLRYGCILGVVTNYQYIFVAMKGNVMIISDVAERKRMLTL